MSMFLYICLILLLLRQRISTSLYGYFTVVEFKKSLYFYFIFTRTVSPLLSSKNPHFHNGAKSSTFLVKMSFICMRLKIISISKAEHLTSFWWTGLGNSEIAYWLLFWCHVSPLCHRNYKCFCPKQYFFSPDRRQGRVEQAIKSSHRFVETFCCYFGTFPLQGNLAVKRCDILTMLLSPSKSATNKHLCFVTVQELFYHSITEFVF